MDNNSYQSPKPSWLMRQFWKACGADPYLLEKSTYADQIKYFCLGGIVIATGALAAMSGGYAIYTIFEPKGNALDGLLTQKAIDAGSRSRDFIHYPTMFIACVFGVIWGAIIYNIDRFIVASTGKGDGTEAITKQEMKSAIPRIIMGLIIALTISKPIEIRMFQSEIDAKLSSLQDKEFTSRKKIIDFNMQSEFDKETNKIKKIDEERGKIELKLNDYDRRFADETMGKAGARGYGPEAKVMEIEKNKWQRKLDDFDELNQPEKKKIKKNIEEIEVKRTNKYSAAEKEVAALDGLLIRLKLAHEIAGFWISLFITLLFIVIELTPIFFKMMLIKGPYDYMDENVKELARAEAGIQVIYNYYEGKEGSEEHKVINHPAILKEQEQAEIFRAQEEINKEIIARWKEQKMKDIRNNPTDHFTEKNA